MLLEITILINIITSLVTAFAWWYSIEDDDEEDDEYGLPQLDWEAAKATIPVVTQIPDYSKYNKDWPVDDVALSQTALWFADSVLPFVNTESNKLEDRIYALSHCEVFISAYANQINKQFPNQINQIPWGKNWYAFSVSVPYMLSVYLLTERPIFRTTAAQIILKTIESPTKSLGYRRSEVNSVYLAGPWILAKYALSPTIAEQARFDLDYQYCMDYLKLSPTIINIDPGLYPDYGLITHTNVVSYGYVFSIPTYGKYLLAFEPQIGDINTLLESIKDVLYHKTLPYTAIGLTNRTKTITHAKQSTSKYGVDIIPSVGFIRLYTEDFSFSMRLQKQQFAFYEADKSENSMAQYWVQCRRAFGKAFYPLKFNEIGLIYKPFSNSLISIPSTGTTTSSFLPNRAESGCIMYKNVIYATNEYYIDKLGAYSVRECIRLDADTGSVVIVLNIIALEEYAITLDKEYKIYPNKPFTIAYSVNQNGATIVNETEESLFSYKHKIIKDEYNNLILVDRVPKIIGFVKGPKQFTSMFYKDQFIEYVDGQFHFADIHKE